jgi:GNAT superfamily N-acetyltransferase
MLSLKPVRPDEVSLLLALIGELAEFEKLSHEVVATEAVLRESLFGERRVAEVVLARVDGVPAGFALYFHSFSTFLGRTGLYLEDLYVRSDYRGQGVGTALLGHVAAVAVERGCGRLEWSVLDWNRRAIDFYAGMGAGPVAGWTVYRLTGNALLALGRGHPGDTPPAGAHEPQP